MSAPWILVPCLVSLRAEFNTLAPARDKTSDGSIGDPAHQLEPSDHNPDETGNTPTKDADHVNEVHAIDVDDDLRRPDWSMSRALTIIIGRHRSGQDDRLQNVIYNRQIWSRSWGWTPKPYSGKSAHTEHAHFSARYTSAQEADTRPWGLLDAEGDDDMATITQTDFNARMDAWWQARMAANAPDNPARAALRIAPWQQLVGRTGKSTHEVLFGDMATQLAKAAGETDPAILAQSIITALPAGLARQVVDELHARLEA